MINVQHTYDNLRTYGEKPFRVALVHGGPGASGEMAPVACELSSQFSILEPFQTEVSLHGQVEELRDVLEKNVDEPIVLVGFSWGAWLSFIFTAKYPHFVKQLILVGSPSYEEKYVEKMNQIRSSRFTPEETAEISFLWEQLNDPSVTDKNTVLTKIGRMFSKADAYDPYFNEAESGDTNWKNRCDVRADIFLNVWDEAARMRKSGELLEIAGRIKVPVIALHGDYDPHPAEGVKEPLSLALERFNFVLLKKCGHKPWIERQARDEFYRILRELIER